MSTYAQPLTPELQLALLQAVMTSEGKEYGASRAGHVRGRITGVLGGAAASVAVYDALLLFVA